MRLERSYIPFAVLLLVHLFFFSSSIILKPASLSDSTDYLNASNNLYKQGILYCGDLDESLREEQFTRRPPLYPVLLGIGLLTGSNIPVFFLQIGLSLFSIFLVIRIFDPGDAESGNREPSEKSKQTYAFRFIALILLLVTPAQFIYASRIMAEIPFQWMLVFAAWNVSMYFRESDNRYIWLFHLAITLGIAIKPILFPFAILTILISIYLFLKKRNPAFILAISLPVIWIIAFTVWNYQRVGSFQYSSIQTANMVNYNLRYFIMSQEGTETASEEVDRLYVICGSEASYAEKNKCLGREVRRIILDKPVRYALFHLKGSVRYFFDPGRFDLVTFFDLQEPGSPGLLNELHQHGLTGVLRFLKNQGWGLVILLGVIALFKLFKVAGFLMYVFRSGQDLPFRIFLVLLIGYMALVTGPLGASRFLLPVELLIIGGAVKGWFPLLKIKNLVKFRQVG